MLFKKSTFAKIYGPVTFLLNYVDIQLILEFKNGFGKYLSVCPKNP